MRQKNNKLDWVLENKYELIDIIETITPEARKGEVYSSL